MPGEATATTLRAVPTPGANPGLKRKLLDATAAVHTVEKKGRNDSQHYDYVQAADVYAACRSALTDRGLLVTHDQVSEETHEVPTKNGGKFYITKVTLKVTLEDVDTGESRVWERVVGWGSDSLDKGIYKALTGAMKYWFILVFKLPTGVDPEVPSAAELAEARGDSSSGTKKRKDAPAAPPQDALSPAQQAQKERGVKLFRWLKGGRIISSEDAWWDWVRQTIGSATAPESWTPEQSAKIEEAARRFESIIRDGKKLAMEDDPWKRFLAQALGGKYVVPFRWTPEQIQTVENSVQDALARVAQAPEPGSNG